MSKTQPIFLDYRSLLIPKIKENFPSLLIGIIIILIPISIAIFFSYSFLKSKVITKKENPPAVAAASKQIRTYIIQEGDQLWLIAQKLYGSGFNMEDIMKANSITNPDLIEVGQKLIIPDVKPRYPTTGNIASGVQTSQVTSPQSTYVVKEGDDLASISLQVYGDSYAWTKIAQANNLVNPNILQVGTVLQIPR